MTAVVIFYSIYHPCYVYVSVMTACPLNACWQRWYTI